MAWTDTGRQALTHALTMMRATISALETPRDLGMSSPKTSVTTVRPTVEYATWGQKGG